MMGICGERDQGGLDEELEALTAFVTCNFFSKERSKVNVKI